MTKSSPPRPTRENLSTARLIAVQALYDADITERDSVLIVEDFSKHGLGTKTFLTDENGEETEVALADPDHRLFSAIVIGALSRKEELDGLVAAALTGSWTLDRLEDVLRCILRAAAFELAADHKPPSKVIISEYVAVAGAFYAGPEPGMVNAILDRIARQLRSSEFGGDAIAG